MKRYIDDVSPSLLLDENPRKKFKSLNYDEEKEEERLTSLLFSGSTPVLNNLNNDTNLFSIDNNDNNDDQDISEEDNNEKEDNNKSLSVWHDDDDDNIEINLLQSKSKSKYRENIQESIIDGKTYENRLRSKFESIYEETPEWAQITDNNDNENDILRTTDTLITSTSRLPKKTIKLTKMNDANIKDQTKLYAQIVKFHPSVPLLLTAGYKQSLKLFQIDGKNNIKLQGLNLKDLQITSAFFNKNGQEIVCTGQKNFYYTFDLTSGEILRSSRIRGCDEKSYENTIGNDNYIAVMSGDTTYLLDSNSKQWINNFKMNSKVLSGSFSSDSTTLSTCGNNGEVYIWDLRQQKCIHRYKDEGSIQCTSIAHSKENKYTAIGSTSGIVNLYNTQDIYASQDPKPIKNINNLTTKTSHIKFNHDSQILGISSDEIERQLRLVHLPSNTVFSNFPSKKDPLSIITDFDFSPNSGYLAIGNKTGRILLYRLNYYSSA